MSAFEIKKRILEVFCENGKNFISGEKLSRLLGFSRAAVWKYVREMRDEGFAIVAAPRRGYCLKSMPDKVLGYMVAAGLDAGTIGRGPIYYHESTGSTNDRAYELAERGAPEGTLVIAERQTHGRGRRGRKWISPREGGIYASIVLRPAMEADEIPAVTIVAAISVTDAIKKMCAVKAGLKWPNDVLVSGKKICGILVEIKAEPDTVDFLILGIGVNVNADRGELPAEATSLKAETNRHVNRAELLRHILRAFDRDYALFTKKGFSASRTRSRALSLVLGKRVRVTGQSSPIEGTAQDIDAKGALVLTTDNGTTRRIFSGDIILPKI
ncbi:MAG: biotin--[acetyl-CoA-carboxylase] ligase [Candidatus Omnitrophota bacterium]